jgi:type I restriction enzyme R subunit
VILRDYDVIDLDDVQTATDTYFALAPARRNQAVIYQVLRPAVDRYAELGEDEQAEFKSAVDRFVRMYAFLSQVFPDNDADTERLYVYCRALLQDLPDGGSGRLQLADSVVMTHLSLETSAEGAIVLDDQEPQPLPPFPGEGRGGGGGDADTDTLSNIIEQINQAKGLNLDDTQDDELRPVAASNTYEDFLLEFKKQMIGTLLGVEKSNRELFDALIQDKELRDQLGDYYAPQVFHALREQRPGDQS